MNSSVNTASASAKGSASVSSSHTRNQGTRYYGKYRGIVSNNQDPNNMGRLKARVSELLGDVESGWALPCVPYAADGAGHYLVPPVDAGVWVEFESGDLSRPIWSGCWWRDSQVPADNAGTQATPPLKVIRSEQGLMFTMDDGSQTITVSDSGGTNLLEILVQEGKITIKGTSKAVVEAPAIELVENASHPVVFGDQLLQYLNQVVSMFNSHMHPGELAVAVLPVTPAPPVPLLTPPTPSLLSNIVKAG